MPAPSAPPARAAQPRDPDPIPGAEPDAVRRPPRRRRRPPRDRARRRDAWARAPRPRGADRCGTRRRPRSRTRISFGRGSGIARSTRCERPVVDRPWARRRSRPSHGRLRDSADPCRGTCRSECSSPPSCGTTCDSAGITYHGAPIGRGLADRVRRTRPDTRPSARARRDRRVGTSIAWSDRRAGRRNACAAPPSRCAGTASRSSCRRREQRLERLDVPVARLPRGLRERARARAATSTSS